MHLIFNSLYLIFFVPVAFVPMFIFLLYILIFFISNFGIRFTYLILYLVSFLLDMNIYILHFSSNHVIFMKCSKFNYWSLLPHFISGSNFVDSHNELLWWDKWMIYNTRSMLSYHHFLGKSRISCSKKTFARHLLLTFFIEKIW